jgi:hypothetical protein
LTTKSVLLAILAFWLSNATADTTEFSWQGFVAQGLIQAPDSSFVNRSGDVSTELTELGLNGRLKLAPSWHLAGQLVYLDGGNRYPVGGRVDYLFLDWSFYNTAAWQGNLYLGRVKNQHWLYSSTRDVPFTRPSIVLPQSIYFDGFRDIAVSSDGIALQLRNSGHYGDLTFNWSLGTIPITSRQSRLLLGHNISGRTELNRDQKASLYWQPALSHFSFGMVLQDAAFAYQPGSLDTKSAADFTVQRVMLNLRYHGEHWEFASELQQERIETVGFFGPQFGQQQLGQGGYMLVQYHHSASLRWYSFLDYAVLEKDDRWGRQLTQQSGDTIPAYFGFQHTLATGASLDLTSQWRLQAEMHWNRGTGRLSPVIQPDILTNNSEYWQLYALQLMYRF